MIYEIFPFDKIKKNQRIIIWGNGKLGKSYMEQIGKIEYCTVLYVVDSDEEKFSNEIHVKSPAYLENDIDARNYSVVIAISDITSSNIVINKLTQWGWPRDNIISEVRRLIIKNNKRTAINISKGIFEFNELLHKKLRIMRPCCDKEIIRVGNRNDGGYLMLNDFERGSIAYSFGIGADIGWETHVSRLGYDVYMYDHTVDCPLGDNDRLHFFKNGISSKNNINSQLNTLDNFIKKNRHDKEKNMILKMDVEGAERDAIIDMYDGGSSVLNRFDQVVVELHDLHDNKCHEKILEMLDKINMTHQLIHLHGNNASKYLFLEGSCLPNVVEATYLNKSLYDFHNFDDMLPLRIDMPNLIDEDDILLGMWNEE